MYARNRTQDQETDTVVVDFDKLTLTNGNLQLTEHNQSGSFDTSGGLRVTNDWVTERFAEKRNQGIVICNPYDSTLDTWRINPLGFYAYQYWDNQPYHYHEYEWTGTPVIAWNAGNISSLPTFALDGINVENMKSLALTSAWAKTTEPEVFGLVTAAEIVKTYNGLISLYKTLHYVSTRAYRAKTALKAGLITASKAAEIWMSCRYGLRPLYHDVVDTISALKAEMNKLPRTRFTSTLSDTESVEEEWDSVAPAFSSDFTMSGLSRFDRNVSVSAGVLVESRSNMIPVLENFGLDRLAESAWELIPYSFIIDWFFNTGKFIASWSPKVYQRALCSWVVVRDERSTTHEITDMQCTSSLSAPHVLTQETVNHNGGAYHTYHKSTVRTADPSKPVIPSLNIRLDVAKLLDLSVISYNLLRGMMPEMSKIFRV